MRASVHLGALVPAGPDNEIRVPQRHSVDADVRGNLWVVLPLQEASVGATGVAQTTSVPILATMAAGLADASPGPFVFSPGNFDILTAGESGDVTRAVIHAGFFQRACWAATAPGEPSGESRWTAMIAAAAAIPA